LFFVAFTFLYSCSSEFIKIPKMSKTKNGTCYEYVLIKNPPSNSKSLTNDIKEH
jgi:hypothetical protein